MKLAFTIHWYGGYPADVPTTHETYIADIPDDLLPAEVRELANREQAVNANRLRDSMEQAIRHQKYKRCLAMAEWCDTEIGSRFRDGDYEDIQWYQKWYKRWIELANQFKEERHDQR